MPFPGHRALRKGRASLPGQVHLVTVVSRERPRHFANFAAACAVASLLGDATAWRDARAMAWVLMPDHWHALVQLGEVNSLSAAMQRINSLTARAANQTLGRTGQIWPSAYHDHALRADEDVRTAARYLVANPLRAGLVDRVGDYSFWDAVWLDGKSHPLSP